MSYQLRDLLSTTLAELANKPTGLTAPEVSAMNTQLNEVCALADDPQFSFEARISNDQTGLLALQVRIQERKFNNSIGWNGIDRYAVYVSALVVPTTTVVFCGLAVGKYGSSSENDIAARAALVRNRVTAPNPVPPLSWTPLVAEPGSVGPQLVAAVQQRVDQIITTNYQSGSARGQLNKAHTRSLAALIVGDIYSLPPGAQNQFPSDEDFWATVKAWYGAFISSGYPTAQKVQEIGTEQSTSVASQSMIVPDFNLKALETSPPSFLIGLENPWQQAIRALLLGKHVIFYGPPGCGKTTLAIALCEALGRPFDPTTASPEWGAFDTVGGYVVQPGGQFSFQAGIVIRSIEANTWLIIDEINRANIDRALGPLFSMLTGPSQTNSLVTLQYKDAEENPLTVGFADGCSYQIMPDWRILGTMNTMDKVSLFRLSYAFSRRFAFIEVPPPSQSALEALLRNVVVAPMYTLRSKELHRFLMDLATELQANAEVEIGAAVLIDVLKAIDAQLTNGTSIFASNVLPLSTISDPTNPEAPENTVATLSDLPTPGGVPLTPEELPADGVIPVPTITDIEVKAALLNAAKMLMFPQFEGNRAAHSIFINAIKNGIGLSAEEEAQLNKDLRLWTGVEVS
jgi:MoxR-like ATPase